MSGKFTDQITAKKNFDEKLERKLETQKNNMAKTKGRIAMLKKHANGETIDETKPLEEIFPELLEIVNDSEKKAYIEGIRFALSLIKQGITIEDALDSIKRFEGKNITRR